MARTWATGEQHHIIFEDNEAWITEVGATLRAFRDSDGDIIDGLTQDEPISAGRGQVLMPWPNRIRDGRYEFEGKTQQLPITEVPKNNSSHGILRWVNWQVDAASRTEASVTLTYAAHAQPGFPFAFDARITYTVLDAGLLVEMSATNAGRSPMPFGMGAHPYFTTGTETVDSNAFVCPAASYLEADEQAIPTKEVAVDAATDFRTRRSLKDEPLNLCYTKLDRDEHGIARFDVIRDGSNHGVRVWMDETFDYVMVYTADDIPGERRRKGIAIEPMTCAPDAFNNKMGLLVLQPGESVSGAWGVQRVTA